MISELQGIFSKSGQEGCSIECFGTNMVLNLSYMQLRASVPRDMDNQFPHRCSYRLAAPVVMCVVSTNFETDTCFISRIE